MFDWLFSSQSEKLLIPPPQFIQKGTIINGILFPERVMGFVRFNYNEVFKNIPWISVKSYWENKVISWNCGEIEQFNGQKKIITKNIGSSIHPCWKQLGYFPCYWRRSRIVVDKPVGTDPFDAWPSAEIEIKKNYYVIVFSGEIAIHEICKPIPKQKGLFQHQILVNPLQTSKLAKYYKNEDCMVDIRNENGKLSLIW